MARHRKKERLRMGAGRGRVGPGRKEMEWRGRKGRESEILGEREA